MVKMKMRSLLIVVFVVVGCGRPSAPVPPEVEHQPWPARREAFDIDLTAHREAGWLVVRTPTGSRDEGDSLTWSAEAMGVSCEQAAATLTALEAMQDVEQGYYVRVEPLPERYVANHDVVSRDGWVSLAYGMTRSWWRCQELRPRITTSWQRAVAAVGSATRLHPNAPGAVVTPWFRYVVDAMSSFVGGDVPQPSVAARSGYELAVETTVRSVVGSRGACYPLHLALDEILALASMGTAISTAAKQDLCEATAATGLLTWGWYCHGGVSEVASWLEQYQPNQIVYRHQRCSWEVEDFPFGDTAASLDWLTLRDLYVSGG